MNSYTYWFITIDSIRPAKYYELVLSIVHNIANLEYGAMPFADVNGTTIHYSDTGAGLPLVLIHGIGASLEMWRPQIDEFSGAGAGGVRAGAGGVRAGAGGVRAGNARAVATRTGDARADGPRAGGARIGGIPSGIPPAGSPLPNSTCRVIAIDARGVGKSGKLRGWTRIVERQAKDLACLLEHLGIEKAVVCGISYGAVLAQRFALDYPQNCKALCVIDSYSTSRPRNIKELGWLINVYLGAPSNLLPKKWLAKLMRTVYKRWPDAASRMAEIALKLRGFETMKTRLAINNIDYLPELGRITVPTLCAVGGSSWPLSIPFMQKTTDAIPGCDKLRIIPGSYDPSNLCQPKEFNTLLSGFLAELERP